MDKTETIKYFVWQYGDRPERSNKIEKSKSIALEEQPLTKTDMDLTFTEFIQLSQSSSSTQKYRDEANNKLNMRYMVQQVSQNPFLQGTNYIDDIEIQEKFLRPKQEN
jgi:hypothetical protein